MTERTTIAVALCTYKRADVLDRLLATLAEHARDVGELAAVGVAVVDDDPAASARDVVEAHAGDFELGVRYANTASGDLAVARNRQLDEGTAIGEWLALIDDDCVPEDGWLRELVAAQRRWGADAVSGDAVDVPAPGAPSWLTDEPVLADRRGNADGERIVDGYLKNTLISARFLADHAIRFDLDYGKTSGEDTMFFHATRKAGMHHRFAAKAVVREEVPLARCTLRYQMRRHLWIGGISAVTMRTGDGRPTWLLVAGGLKLGARRVVEVATTLVRRRRLHWHYLLCGLAEAAGRLQGALFGSVSHR